MITERPQYLAYMLRLWQDQGVSGPQWRASLESPHTGERHGFTSLEALFDFLMQCSRVSQRLAEADSDQTGPVKG